MVHGTVELSSTPFEGLKFSLNSKALFCESGLQRSIKALFSTVVVSQQIQNVREKSIS